MLPIPPRGYLLQLMGTGGSRACFQRKVGMELSKRSADASCILHILRTYSSQEYLKVHRNASTGGFKQYQRPNYCQHWQHQQYTTPKYCEHRKYPPQYRTQKYKHLVRGSVYNNPKCRYCEYTQYRTLASCEYRGTSSIPLLYSP